MKKNNRTRKVIIVLVCILIPLGALGFGYFIGGDKINDKDVTHTLTVDGSIGGSVTNTQETNMNGIVPGDTVEETININPNATTPSLLRVKIEPSWHDGNEKIDLSTSNIELIYADDIVKSNFDTKGNDYWYKNDDGYLYYMNSVTTKDKAIELVKGIKFLGGNNDEDASKYQGKKLKIDVTMDMIQCKYAPYKEKWKIQSSNLNNKLEELCPESDKVIEQ